MAEGLGAKLKSIFVEFDSNKQHVIPREKLVDILKQLDPTWTQDELDTLFEVADKDENGVIDYDEFIDFICFMDYDDVVKDKKEQEALAPKKEDEGDVWYFAIGSMVNPTSLAARGLKPKQSVPAKLLNHRMVFAGTEGMASQEEASGESFHGVLHLMSPEDMKKLDAIEGSYDRVISKSQLYDGKEQDCTVYKMSMEKMEKMGAKVGTNNTPQQRYIDIILEGCKHFGVDQQHLDWLKGQPCRERTKPEEYLKFEVPEGTPVMSLDEIKVGDGVEDHPAYWVANKKVLEYKGPKAGPMWEQNKTKAGTNVDMLFEMAQKLYDPLFGVPTSQEEMTTEHYQYREDLCRRMLMNFGFADMLIVVGMLE